MNTNVTDRDIEDLETEAAYAGDRETVRDCQRALCPAMRGAKAARVRVERIILDARSEAESERAAAERGES